MIFLAIVMLLFAFTCLLVTFLMGIGESHGAAFGFALITSVLIVCATWILQSQ